MPACRVANPAAEVVILGLRDDARVRALHEAAATTFSPGKTVLVAEKDEAYVPDAVEHMRKAPEARREPAAFVCTGNVCAPPTADPERLRGLLRGGIRT